VPFIVLAKGCHSHIPFRKSLFNRVNNHQMYKSSKICH